jgi:hypothetical protein
VALVATPALAQPPGYQPPAGQAPGGLPLPPGYRPRTPPPQAQPQHPAGATGALPGSGGSGRVMYFQKPADALTATGGTNAGEGVARADVPPAAVPVPVPDAAPPVLPPPPPASRYLPPPTGPAEKPITPPLPVPALAELPVPTPVPPVLPPATTGVRAQPEVQPDAKKVDQGDIPPSTSLKKDAKIVPVDPKYIQLPSRANVFTVYDDAQLEKAIMERLREDLRKDKKYTKEQEQYLVFPPLPVISPPGVPYQAKTVAYEPRKLIVEPGYVVHRRLYFEEKNAERAGWDFGPMQVLVSTVYFWKDAASLPHNVASGCVYGWWDTSAGKCLPGSPSPYYLYPPGLTLSGSLAEGVFLTAIPFIFP